jgi:sugar phosphate isomerase/epimerase
MTDRDRLGIVSNCWRTQLEAGVALKSLVASAAEAGFRFIELRQGCLGECEDRETLMPNINELALLNREFGEVQFNLAVQLPFFSAEQLAESQGISRLLDAAAACGGHLRIVDLTTIQPLVSEESLALRASQIEEWTTRLGRHGTVSIEHAMQPWNAFWSAFDSLRQMTSGALMLCYDPCNLLLTDDGSRAAAITVSIPVDAVSMVHLKQSRDGAILPSFASKESLASKSGIDWPGQIQLLTERHYDGPILFEIAPSDDAHSHLTAARQWVIDHLPPAIRGADASLEGASSSTPSVDASE